MSLKLFTSKLNTELPSPAHEAQVGWQVYVNFCLTLCAKVVHSCGSHFTRQWEITSFKRLIIYMLGSFQFSCLYTIRYTLLSGHEHHICDIWEAVPVMFHPSRTESESIWVWVTQKFELSIPMVVLVVPFHLWGCDLDISGPIPRSPVVLLQSSHLFRKHGLHPLNSCLTFPGWSMSHVETSPQVGKWKIPPKRNCSDLQQNFILQLSYNISLTNFLIGLRISSWCSAPSSGRISRTPGTAPPVSHGTTPTTPSPPSSASSSASSSALRWRSAAPGPNGTKLAAPCRRHQQCLGNAQSDQIPS